MYLLFQTQIVQEKLSDAERNALPFNLADLEKLLQETRPVDVQNK